MDKQQSPQQQPRQQQQKQHLRKMHFDELVSETDCAFESGAEYPPSFERYLVVEKNSGEIAWFYLADSLEDCARLIDQSDTEREQVYILDLDEDGGSNLIIPVIQVSAFIISGLGRVERLHHWPKQTEREVQ